MGAFPLYLQEKQRYTVAEYFELEKQLLEELYEFDEGKIICRAGGTDMHNEITLNVAFAFRLLSKKRGGNCKIYASDVKLEVLRNQKYYYPDVFVTCSKADAESPLLKKEAKIVVEVLSDSTESVDKKDKQTDYLQINSLEQYIRISQKSIFVEVYERKSDFFAYKIYTDLQQEIELANFGNISLQTIYENVKFDTNLTA
jgi:Uma2 family endonuclease